MIPVHQITTDLLKTDIEQTTLFNKLRK